MNRLNCATTCLIVLSVCSTHWNISGEVCQRSSLQWVWIQQNSGRSLQIPWKKYFQVGFWHCISAAESLHQHLLILHNSNDRHQSESARSHCSISKDCVWVDECFSNATIAKWSNIQACLKKTKKFQLRARCHTTWEQDAVQTTRRPWKGQNSKNLLPSLLHCNTKSNGKPKPLLYKKIFIL